MHSNMKHSLVPSVVMGRTQCERKGKFIYIVASRFTNNLQLVLVEAGQVDATLIVWTLPRARTRKSQLYQDLTPSD